MAHTPTDTPTDRRFKNGRESYYVRDANHRAHGPFDAIVFAIGFGAEPNATYGIRTPGYWEHSPFDFKGATVANPKRILVSGSGDGGLLDVLSAAIVDFQQENLLTLVPRLSERSFLRLARRAEKRIRRELSRDSARSVLDIYDDLFSTDVAIEQVKSIVDRTHAVTFNSEVSGLFDQSTSALNRIAVYLLIRSQSIQARRARLSTENIEDLNKQDPAEYIVSWPFGGTQSFDYIVIRHGVKTGRFADMFPQFSDAVDELKRRIAEIDLIQSLPIEIERRLLIDRG
jgi:hypothetical protein